MDFVRSYFFTSCPLFFSSKLDFPVIKRLKRDFFTLSECISNVLITGKSNFDEKKWATGQSCIRKEITSYRIGYLGGTYTEITKCATEKAVISFFNLKIVFCCIVA